MAILCKCHAVIPRDWGFVVDKDNGTREPCGPPVMREMCPECWRKCCAGCGLELSEEHRAKAMPTGRRHYCGDCWPEREMACWEVAGKVLRRREVDARTKNAFTERSPK